MADQNGGGVILLGEADELFDHSGLFFQLVVGLVGVDGHEVIEDEQAAAVLLEGAFHGFQQAVDIFIKVISVQEPTAPVAFVDGFFYAVLEPPVGISLRGQVAVYISGAGHHVRMPVLRHALRQLAGEQPCIHALFQCVGYDLTQDRGFPRSGKAGNHSQGSVEQAHQLFIEAGDTGFHAGHIKEVLGFDIGHIHHRRDGIILGGQDQVHDFLFAKVDHGFVYVLDLYGSAVIGCVGYRNLHGFASPASESWDDAIEVLLARLVVIGGDDDGIELLQPSPVMFNPFCIAVAQRNGHGILPTAFDGGSAVQLSGADQQRFCWVDAVHVVQEGTGIGVFLAPVFDLSRFLIDLMAGAVLDHGEDVVCVVVVKDEIALLVLPDVQIVSGLFGNAPEGELGVHFGFICTLYLFRVPVLVHGLDFMLAEAMLDARQFQKFLGGLGEGETFGLVHIHQIPASLAGAKAAEAVMFFVVNEARSIFSMKRTAGFQVPLIEILQIQFFCYDVGLCFAQTLLGFFYDFFINEQK